MKKRISIIVIMTLIGWFFLSGCERVYPDGEKQEVSFVNACFDFFAGLPSRVKQDELKELGMTGDEFVDAKILEFNKQIAIKNKEITAHNKGAEQDQKHPDDGITGLVSLILGGSGLSFLIPYIQKRNVEKLRRLAVEREVKAKARYQGAKNAVRSDPDELSRVKAYAQAAEGIITDNLDLNEEHSEDLGKLKGFIKLGLSKINI